MVAVTSGYRNTKLDQYYHSASVCPYGARTLINKTIHELNYYNIAWLSNQVDVHTCSPEIEIMTSLGVAMHVGVALYVFTQPTLSSVE